MAIRVFLWSYACTKPTSGPDVAPRGLLCEIARRKKKKEKKLSPEFAVFLSAAAEIESLKETQTVKKPGRQLCVWVSVGVEGKNSVSAWDQYKEPILWAESVCECKRVWLTGLRHNTGRKLSSASGRAQAVWGPRGQFNNTKKCN